MRKKTNKVTFFICSFFSALIITILLDKFIGFRMKIFSWQEIGYDFYLYIIISLCFALWLIFGGVGDKFANRCKNKVNTTSKSNKNERKSDNQ